MSNDEMPLVAVIVLLWSRRTVAKQTDLCEKSIWNATAPRGDLPCVKLGSRTLYRPADVEAWIASRVVRPASAE